MPRMSSIPTFANCAFIFAASTLLTSSPFAQACSKGQQQVFTCSTKNSKIVEVCNAGQDAIYSFGRVGAKPELLLRTPKAKVHYTHWQNTKNGPAAPASRESLQFRNGATSYTVEVARVGNAELSASVEVAANGRHLASVACRDETVVAQLQALGMTAQPGAASTPGIDARQNPKPRRLVFAKRPKPRVLEFVWNAHHPEGVEFDGPIKTSIGTLDEVEVHGSENDDRTDGFALNSIPIRGPHGRDATILGGDILDYGDRLVIIYSYWAKDACMACGSDAVVIVSKGGKVVDQLIHSRSGESESGPNQCLYPSAETIIDGVAIYRADKDCEGINRIMRIGYEGIEASPR